MVFTSSAGVMGPQTSEEQITEKTVRQTELFTEYEKSKELAEEKVLDYCNKGGNAVIVCPTRVYGPGLITLSNPISTIIKLYIDGRFKFIPDNGHAVANYAYIHDVVAGHIQSLQKGRSGEKYILGGENIDYVELFQYIKTHTGINRKLISVPNYMMKLIGAWMDFKQEKLHTPIPFTSNLLKKYSHNWATDISKAKTVLNYTVTPMEIGLLRTVEYITTQHDE